MKKRILSIILTLVMVITLLPTVVFGDNSEILCRHEHDVVCGFIDGVNDAECNHEHDEFCGFLTTPTNKNETGHVETCVYQPDFDAWDCDIDNCQCTLCIDSREDIANQPMVMAQVTSNKTLYFPGDGKLYTIDRILSEPDAPPYPNQTEFTGDGWSGSGTTLILNGLDFSTNADCALLMGNNTTLTLAPGSQNKLTVDHESFVTTGVILLGDATINGTGKLDITSKDRGIAGGGTHLAIDGPTMTVKSTNTVPEYYPAGIDFQLAETSINISNANITFTDCKIGMNIVDGNVTINNSTVKVTGAEHNGIVTGFDGNHPSSGVMTITNSTVEVSAGTQSNALNVGTNLVITNSNVTTSTIGNYAAIFARGTTVINNSTMVATAPGSSGIWSLGDLSISGTSHVTATSKYNGIISESNLVINGGTINTTVADDYPAIYVKGTTSISNSTLTIAAPNSIGISSEQALSISGTGGVSATGKSYAIYSPEDITISGGTITASATLYMAISSKKTLAISGTSNITATSSSGWPAIQGDTAVNITGGTTSATGIGSHGIVSNGPISISGGTVTANSTGNIGIYTPDTLTISDTAKVTATASGTWPAIQTGGNISITGGTTISTATGSHGIVSTGVISISGGIVDATSNATYGIFSANSINITDGYIHAKGFTGYSGITARDISGTTPATAKISLADPLFEKNEGKIGFTPPFTFNNAQRSWTSFIPQDATDLTYNSDTGLMTNALTEVWIGKLNTVTFDSQGGSAVTSLEDIFSGSTISAPTAPNKSGYTFGGWYTESACTTLWNFGTDIIIEDVTLYAKWTRVIPPSYDEPTPSPKPTPTTPPISNITDSKQEVKQDVTINIVVSGNDRSKSNSPVVSVTVKDTALRVDIPQSVLTDAIKQATDLAKNSDEKTTVTLDLKTSENFKTVGAVLPVESVTKLAETVDNLVIQTAFASVNLNSDALVGVASEASESITITVTVVTSTVLPQATQALIGDKPVYDFTITSGNKNISEFDNGRATITIPYTLAESEKPGNVVVYYINDAGELKVVKNCHYDSKTKMASFSTTHFSKYTIASMSINYTDVPDDWFTSAVEYVSVRELFNGIGNNKFDPNGIMTNAMFVTVLANLDDANITNTLGGAWYAPYIKWATENGIISSDFDPNAAITREEMAVVMYNYIQHKNLTLAEVNSTPFGDIDQVSPAAKTAVEYMKKHGLIVGSSNNYMPKNTTTRAEGAIVFMNVIQVLAK